MGGGISTPQSLQTGKFMKRLKYLILFSLMLTMLLSAAPALAAGLGMSPSKIEINVPAESSSTINLQAYYYSGDIKVTLVDIPLRVEPDTVHVEALDRPDDVTITIYGDPSLGSQIYDGFIKFTGMSGEMIAIAVQVKARVSNIVEGDPLPEITQEIIPEENEETVTESNEQNDVDTTAVEQDGTNVISTESDNLIGSLSLNMIILIAAGVIFLGLVILAVSLMLRRRY